MAYRSSDRRGAAWHWGAAQPTFVGSSGLSLHVFNDRLRRASNAIASVMFENHFFFFVHLFIQSIGDSPRTILYNATHFILSPPADQIVWHGIVAKGTDGPASPTSDDKDVTLVASAYAR